jgi:hypothetical protein
MEVPPNSWMFFFFVENPRKMDDLGVPRFRKPPYIYTYYLSRYFFGPVFFVGINVWYNVGS